MQVQQIKVLQAVLVILTAVLNTLAVEEAEQAIHDAKALLEQGAVDHARLQAEAVAAEPERFFRPPYVGHRGWLGVRIDPFALQRGRPA